MAGYGTEYGTLENFLRTYREQTPGGRVDIATLVPAPGLGHHPCVLRGVDLKYLGRDFLGYSDQPNTWTVIPFSAILSITPAQH